MKTNNVMLHTITRHVSFIIFIFSLHLFFSGHHNPGGGFIGGLMTASAFLLMYLSFDMKTMKKVIPFDFTKLIALGLLTSALTGSVSMLLGYPYLTHFFDYFNIWLLGEVELTTALPFDLGIYLLVVGIALTIILTIGEDDQ